MEEYICIKLKKNNLKDWKKHLSSNQIEQLDSDLDDYVWHSVTKDKKVLAIFQIIDVLNKYAKNLDIRFHPTQTTQNKDDEEIINIIIFIFNSIVDICDNNKIKKFKIHTHDYLMVHIFGFLSYKYEKGKIIKSAKTYGKWVEVELL